jgi:hypothetical protein
MYEYLRPFCNTDRQRQLLDTLATHPTNSAAAKTMGIAERNVYRTLRTLKKRAAQQGCAPDHDMTKTVPEGYKVKGVSTLYDGDGVATAQWVKSQLDAADEEVQEEILQAFLDNLPREKAAPACKTKHQEDLLNLYLITDYHLGMKCWWEETGENWDTKIAENMIVQWFQKAIKDSPNAHTAIFGQLGDFLHWDGIEPVTPTSNFSLDVDTRYQKLVRVSLRVIRRIVKLLLKKHDHVHLIMAEGNHDITSSMWLREVFNTWYEDEPRVTVDVSPDPYYAYEWGETSLVFHHGHKRKMANIDSVFASKFRALWGRTKHCYGHMGHLHHDIVKETALMTIEQHRTLAAPDAYASRGGWMSERSAKCITYSRLYGEIERKTITPQML